MIETLLIILMSLQGAVFAAAFVYAITVLDFVTNSLSENIRIGCIAIACSAISIINFYAVFK